MVRLSDIVAYAARRRSLLEYFYGTNRMYYTAEEVKRLMEFVDTNAVIHKAEFKEVDITIKDKRGFCKGHIEFSFADVNAVESMSKVIELLTFAMFSGIGKMTVFGMGQLKISLKS
ncbi:MAG: CRISPR system precrRNA processing endoribonuclease RAMP protein Cas6 [Candidatus Nitrosocaldus sp.]|nr:CRISPR system precrRNA processing endoribonuclease RAMP protein Cas6 [Candidatus Nitrosocaldus sp.]MDW8275777.1 CRISPR system precrRNA processing endoribonuclease RAMP protein Cas6 [Candidatus Nitrosocaldus sp.]